MYDVIIIGGGATGLMAMKTMLKAGYKVCLLEAANTAGGRIATLHQPFTQPAESGAEFIHGDLKLTLQLLKDANIPYEPVVGRMISVRKGKWNTEEEHNEHWEEMLQRLHALENDMTIVNFLDRYFADPIYNALRNTVQRFAEGFDLADISNASILSVKDEWNNMEETQYRIPGGYCQLINYLMDECRRLGGELFFNSVVNAVNYGNNKATVHTTDNKQFECTKIIITVSAGVLKSGNITFSPPLTLHDEAIRQLGFGMVIKILLEFKNPFWKSYADDIGFLLTDEMVPTWWTQLPAESNLLTGWIGGSAAGLQSEESDTAILRSSLLSLSSIFNIAAEKLQEQLVHYKIINWHNHPYIKGGYSYNTIYSAGAKQILSEPVDDTIYFAGEAIYAGESQGTVEAALQSGLAVAEKIINIQQKAIV